MKRLLAVLLVLALVSGSLLAADTAKPITKAGSKALMFDLSGLAALGANNFQGGSDSLQGGLGFKYYISNGVAVRAASGVQIDGRNDQEPCHNGAGQSTQREQALLDELHDRSGNPVRPGDDQCRRWVCGSTGELHHVDSGTYRQ